MAQFRTKPARVEAVRWDGHLGTIQRLMLTAANPNVLQDLGDPTLIIAAPGGDRRAALGDWIVCGADGALVPVPPDAFAATYEPVEDAR